MRLRSLGAAAAILGAAGCGSVSLWPFGSRESPELSRIPANATEYRCNNERRFYVRWLENGAAAWVIYPEREFRLDKLATAEGARYSNGAAFLENNDGTVSLRDGNVAFTGCKDAKEAAR